MLPVPGQVLAAFLPGLCSTSCSEVLLTAGLPDSLTVDIHAGSEDAEALGPELCILILQLNGAICGSLLDFCAGVCLSVVLDDLTERSRRSEGHAFTFFV